MLWKAVTGGSSAVGAERMGMVEYAIFAEAEELAEADVADMERGRAESADENRIARAIH